MQKLQRFIAAFLCCALPIVTFAAEAQVGHGVKYSGGSLPTVKDGEDLKLFIDTDKVRLAHKKEAPTVIPASAVTEISYGQEVHRRIGTAAGVAVVTLGVGAIIAFSKSKKHYIGLVWDDGSGNKGGVALQADKNEFRGLLAALEGVTGKKAVDTDAAKK